MKYDDAIQMLHQMTPMEIARLPRERLLELVAGMGGQEVIKFMFKKNLMVYGGINPYVDDFFETGTDIKLLEMGDIGGLRLMFEKMNTYEELTPVNRARVEAGLNFLS